MTEEKCAQILLVFKALLQARISLCNLIVLSCQYECMALAWMESGYLSTCVSVLSVYFLYICVYIHAGVQCLHTYSFCIWSLTCMCCWNFWTGELCLYRVLSTPAAPCARTHKHITHPTADTHMSPQQPDTAEDMLLTEKERPPYWQTRAFQRVELLGSLITFFFFKYFFSWEPKNFIFIISSSTWRCIFTLTLFLPHGTHIDWFNLECSLSKLSSSKWCDVSFMCHHDRFTRWCNLTTDMVRQENKEGNKLFCLFVVNIKCTL